MSDTSSSIQNIDAAIAHAPTGRRAKMLEQLTDLFLARASHCSDEEIALFDDVITRLAAEIEVKARILLSERLAPVANAPPAIVEMLAFGDEPEVAGPMLMLSERLDEKILIANAERKSQQHLFAISRRRSLGEALTDVLVRRGDGAVAVSVAANPGAKLSESGFQTLVERSAGDDRLAESVGARREIPPHLFLKLLTIASERVREKLRAEHPHFGRDINRMVAHVTGQIM